jgi:hypothetical protein
MGPGARAPGPWLTAGGGRKAAPFLSFRGASFESGDEESAVSAPAAARDPSRRNPC